METVSQASVRAPPAAAGWQFWIDRGGTFTDVIGVSPAGALHVRKVPSVGTAEAGDPGLTAARAILAEAAATPAAGSAAAVAALKVGTTVATNALLTRAGEPVVLVTTAGFADGLRIGYQNRPDIFARHIVLPQRLYASVIEAHERIDAHGAVLTPLDTAQLRADLARARGAGRRAVAIVFLHGWRHPQHERLAAECALDPIADFENCILGKVVDRGDRGPGLWAKDHVYTPVIGIKGLPHRFLLLGFRRPLGQFLDHGSLGPFSRSAPKAISSARIRAILLISRTRRSS